MSNRRFRYRFGVLVPFTNTNLEPDMAMLRPDGVSLHFARLGGYDADAIPDDGQMAGLGASDLSEPLRLIQGVRPDVILYGCTSATLTHGPAFDRELASRIKAQSGAETVTAAGALVYCLRSFGIERIGFASPYVGAINDQAEDFLAQAGVQTVSRADIGRVLDNWGQGELRPSEIIALARRADSAEAQALVLSCTDMRSAEVVDALEAELGKPVICSNQAMIRQACDLLGLECPAGCGRLLSAA